METKDRSKVMFELQTTIEVKTDVAGGFQAFADSLRESIVSAASGHPTVKQFFVQADEPRSEVVVGLRIGKPTGNGVEQIADAVLEEAVRIAQDMANGSNAQAVVRETEAALA